MNIFLRTLPCHKKPEVWKFSSWWMLRLSTWKLPLSSCPGLLEMECYNLVYLHLSVHHKLWGFRLTMMNMLSVMLTISFSIIMISVSRCNKNLHDSKNKNNSNNIHMYVCSHSLVSLRCCVKCFKVSLVFSGFFFPSLSFSSSSFLLQ